MSVLNIILIVVYAVLMLLGLLSLNLLLAWPKQTIAFVKEMLSREHDS